MPRDEKAVLIVLGAGICACLLVFSCSTKPASSSVAQASAPVHSESAAGSADGQADAVALTGASAADSAADAVADAAADAASQAAGPSSCDLTQIPGFGLCEVYTGSSFKDGGQLETYRSGCEASNGVFAATSCPHGTTRGTCVFASGAPGEYAQIYYDNDNVEGDTGALQAACVKDPANRWVDAGKYASAP